MTTKLNFRKEQAVFSLIATYNKLAAEIDPFNYGDIETVETTVRIYNRFTENYLKTIEELREELSDYFTFLCGDPYQQPLCDLSNEFFEQLDYMEEL